MFIASLLASSLLASGSPDQRLLTVELHPASLLATTWLQVNPDADKDGNSSNETRLVQLEADVAWRIAPTASLVASVSNFPTISAEVDHLRESGERIGRSTHRVSSIGLDAGIRRHAEDRRGLCFDVLATIAFRAYDARLDWLETRRNFRGSQWRFGILGKPGYHWSWNRFTLRAGIGFGLDWGTSLKDSTLLVQEDREVLPNGGIRTTSREIHAMDEIMESTGGMMPQGELDLAMGWRF